MLLVILAQQLKGQENAKEWTGFANPADNCGVVFELDPDSISIDDNIDKIFFDVSKFDIKNPNSLYEAINFVSIERKEMTRGGSRYFIRKVDENVNFSLNSQRLVELMIQFRVAEFDIIPKKILPISKNTYTTYLWAPNSLVLDLWEEMRKYIDPHAYKSNPVWPRTTEELRKARKRR